MKDPVVPYLATYAEPEARAIVAAMAPRGPFAQCVVIPAMGEGASLGRALASISEPSTLIVLVVNGRADAEAWVHRRNAALPDVLARTYGPACWLTTPDSLPRMGVYLTPTGALLLLHRGEAGHFLPPRQGVGLARKIGADVALALHHAKVVASPWLGCTDADVVLPADYFAQMRALPSHAAAATFPFVHGPESDPARARAIAHYEATLRYYVQGLRWAGSPYAFHTVGSTLAVHATAYARVRGFPRLLAAEDFYVLDKLRKVGPVVALQGLPLMLSGRVSPRVPFGTGRAMLRAAQAPDMPDVYHPHAFIYLRAYLDLLKAAAHAPLPLHDLPDLPAPLDRHVLARAIALLGTQKAIDTAHSSTKSLATRRRFLHTWFDAFRTLKFIHHLREHALASLPLCEAAAATPFALDARTPDAVWAELARREQGSYDSTHADTLAHF